jgi:hypothetical protein
LLAAHRAAQLARIAKRAQIIEDIADRNDATRELRAPTQKELDAWWPHAQVWQVPGKGKVQTKVARRYRGSRANEDEAAIVRREIVRIIAQEPPHLSASRLASIVAVRMSLPPDIKPRGLRALRRLIAQLR